MTETIAASPIETRDTKLEIIMGREALDKLADATVLVYSAAAAWAPTAVKHLPAAALAIS